MPYLPQMRSVVPTAQVSSYTTGTFDLPSDIFDPRTISGLKLWLDAADTSTITLNGSTVSQWNDKSGNAQHFSQATASAQPTSGIELLNGRNVLRFDGGDRLVNTDKTYFKILHDGSTTLVAGVWRAHNPSASPTLTTLTPFLGNQGLTSTKTGITFYFQEYEELYMWCTTGSSGNQPIGHPTGFGNLPTAKFNVFTAVNDADNGTQANRSIARLNRSGQIKNQTSSTSTSPNTANATHDLCVGSDGNTTYLTGAVAELIIYEGTQATDENAVIVRDYLLRKWGL